MTSLSHAMAGRGLSVVGLTPVELRGRIWLCLGFEPLSGNHGGTARGTMGDAPHLAFVHARTDWLKADDLQAALLQTFAGRADILTRLHSECILGDALGSSMCDCGDQLRLAMEEMEAHGEGIALYLRQEGRGIGLRNKLDVLALQYGFESGRRTGNRLSSDEANLAKGFAVDERDYAIAGRLLGALGVRSVQLITGNPTKISDLDAAGVTVTAAVDLWTSHGTSARALGEIAEKVSRGYIYQR